MFNAPGDVLEFVDMPREKMAETCSVWPHGYIRMNVKPYEFLEMFSTNHVHVIPGDHTKAIRMYCDLMDIEVDTVRD